VQPRSVKVEADPSHGTTLEVSLAEGSDAERARQVLGQYPFQFRLLPIPTECPPFADDLAEGGG
jgi:hypothetical protein